MRTYSIVIPLYNKSEVISIALDSIRKQNFQEYEVLIINDGSTDNSIEIVENWINSLKIEEKGKYTIINQQNFGVSTARNIGVQNAKTDYIVFLDADDYWEENHLFNLNRLVDKFEFDVDIFSCAIKLKNENTFLFPNLKPYEDYFGIIDFFQTSLISQAFVHSSSVCVKRDALIKTPFPKDMKNFEDIITWARMACCKGLAFSSERTSVYVTEKAEASRNVDFMNYIKFEQMLFALPYEKVLLQRYIKKIFLYSILAARIDMPYISYISEVVKVFSKSKHVTIYSVLGGIIPKFILRYIRNIRNNKRSK